MLSPLLLCVSVLTAPPPCRKACFPDEVRNAAGCCVPQTPAPGATGPSAVGCPTGQEISADTAGHCCWPSQAWNGSACVGLPSRCPEGMRADAAAGACVLPPCEGGRVRASDALHCCWPNQAWATARKACIGMPQCPEGLAVKGETCERKPSCSGGLTLTPEQLHCCWPGQSWGGTPEACTGTPTCPSGLVARGPQCLPPFGPALAKLRGALPLSERTADLVAAYDCRCRDARFSHAIAAEGDCSVTVLSEHRDQLCGSFFRLGHCPPSPLDPEHCQHSRSEGDYSVCANRDTIDFTRLRSVNVYCDRRVLKPHCGVTLYTQDSGKGMSFVVLRERRDALVEAFRMGATACGAAPTFEVRDSEF